MLSRFFYALPPLLLVHITVFHSMHGIGTVIGKLGIEPVMNGIDQSLILRRIGNFRAIRELLVLNMKLSLFGCAYYSQPRHLFTVNFLWIGEVSTTKFP